MPSPTDADRALRARARRSGSLVARRLLDQPLRTLGVGGALVLLAATAAFGGLEPAADPGVPAVVPGHVVSAAPFDLTVEKVLWVDDLPFASKSDDANRWIAVTATVVNTSHESVTGGAHLRTALGLTGVDGLVETPVPDGSRVLSSDRLLLDDGSRLSPVQPGLEYPMVFLFEQAGSAAPPTSVELQVVGQTLRESSVDGQVAWFDPTVVARSVLPVREAVDQTAGGDAAEADGAGS